MSHFTVLVIGDNVDGQLQPYHEFECTGTNDQYVQDIDITEEVLNYGDPLDEALDWEGISDRIVSRQEDVDIEDTHKFGYAIVIDGVPVKAVKRTNPNKKWDYWEIGGRWEGFFLKKDGTRTNQAKKNEIDLSKMQGLSAKDASERWHSARNLLGDSIESFIPWGILLKKYPDVEACRKTYWDQEANKRLHASKDFAFEDVERFMVSHDDFVQSVRSKVYTTFAYVKDGSWHEKGTMGYWCSVSNQTMSDGDWSQHMIDMLESLPEDSLLTLVDCHI